MSKDHELRKSFLEALIIATSEGRIAFEWRFEPALSERLLSTLGDEGQWLVVGPNGDATVFGLPVISDPEVAGFLLLTA